MCLSLKLLKWIILSYDFKCTSSIPKFFNLNFTAWFVPPEIIPIIKPLLIPTFFISLTFKEENNFVSGAMRGENIFYYSNGKIRRKIFFDSEGNRSGEWIEFDRNGTLKEKNNY